MTSIYAVGINITTVHTCALSFLCLSFLELRTALFSTCVKYLAPNIGCLFTSKTGYRACHKLLRVRR